MRKIIDEDIFNIDKSKLSYINDYEYIGSHPYRNYQKSINFTNTYFELPKLYSYFSVSSSLEKYYYFRRPNQDFFSLEYIYSGEVYIKSNNISFVAEAGDLVLLHHNRDNALLYNSKEQCKKCGLILGGEALDSIITQLNLQDTFCIKIDNQVILEQFLSKANQSIENILDANIGSIDLYADNSSAAFGFLQYIALLTPHKIYSTKALEIRDYLINHYLEDININQICRHFGFSQPKLNDIYRKNFATTPWKYLQNFRLNRATILLQNHDFLIKEIASMVGYKNVEHFSSEFKRIYGVSPYDYRKQHQLF